MVLQWMGMNALIIFALGACELFPAALQGLYWRSPENNLVSSSLMGYIALFNCLLLGVLSTSYAAIPS